jgi:hypothetical protein
MNVQVYLILPIPNLRGNYPIACSGKPNPSSLLVYSLRIRGGRIRSHRNSPYPPTWLMDTGNIQHMIIIFIIPTKTAFGHHDTDGKFCVDNTGK